VAGDDTEVFEYDPKSKCIKTLTVEKSILQKQEVQMTRLKVKTISFFVSK
jgi:hypothetical protein